MSTMYITGITNMIESIAITTLITLTILTLTGYLENV